ncbi:Ig-like domain-containing protein [Cohnella cellulosilytica]|uniref:Ig-like domain-containing protein n=1 Tax=Cohnella cellulosilytica TaxID=986710 RepID=A0ABW2FAF1_9BACL
MRLKRTLFLTLIMTLVAQLWIAGASFAAPSGPIMVATYPASYESTVPANAKLKIKFDENVYRGSGGTVSIKNSNTNATVASYDMANSAHNSYVRVDPASADTILIEPNGSLVAGQSYYVEISPNAFTNAAGAGFAGINNATTWNFGVIASDTTAPSATPIPSSGGTIAATGVIQLVFNEKVFAAVGNIQVIRLDTNDTQVISVLSPEVTGSGVTDGSGKTTISIQPSIRLVSGKSYRVIVPAGAFVDVVGNSSNTMNWTFNTTASSLAPTQKLPTDNATNVAIGAFTAKMTFATPIVTGTSGFIYLKKVQTNETVSTINMANVSDRNRVTGSGTATINIAFAQPLVASTEYYIMIDPGVLRDTGGNIYEGIVDAVTWSFTTQAGVDNVRPLVNKFIPASGGSITAVNGTISLEFNEVVKPGSGTIVLRNVANQAVVCSIPVTHGAVTGGGTNKISITPSAYSSCGSFVKNTTYAVQIGSLAITDLAGNAYAGIGTTDFTTWRFSVATDTVKPELVSTSPVVGSNSVKLDAVFSMIFDKPVQVTPGATATLYRVVSGTTRDPISAALAMDGTDSKKILMTPTTLLQGTSSYIVSIPDNAIADLAGNTFPGILNDYRWTFQTLGSDKTAPAIQNAAMDGGVIVLTYNEELDSTVVPYPANYYVTVNENPRQVNAVTINGNTVRLTLQSGVAVGQTVKVSYTRDVNTAKQLQDLSGNKAAAFTNRDVTNTTDTTLPRPVSGVLNGSTLTLHFNKSLAAVNSNARSQFTVKINGSSYGISSIASSGSTVTLTLSSSVNNTQTASVTYVQGSYPLRDTSGNAVVGFNDFYIQNVNDTVPPVLSGATASGTKITLIYNEGLSPSSIPQKSNFSVIVAGSAATLSSIAITNNIVELTMAQTIATNAVVYVSYIPTSQGIKDLAGNLAPAINSYQVTGTAATTATLLSATVYQSELTLTYSAPLSTASVPYASQYYLKVNGVFSSITNVNVSGSQVRLTLSVPVGLGSTATLSYMTAGNALKDLTNQPVAGFTDTSVTNQSSSTGGGGGTIANLPDYMEGDGSGGVQFLTEKASSTSLGSTPSGKTMPRYTLDGTKFLGAYDSIRTNSGVTVPRLTFKVPSTELGAIVAVPIGAIMDASARASNTSFRVEYGEYQFELPLLAVNYSKEIYLAGGNTTSSYLQFIIEKVPGAPVISTLNIFGAQSVATPADFSAGILTGSNYRAIDNYEQYVTRSFLLPGFTGSASNTAVVRFDPEANQTTYVPTQFDNVGGATRASFKRKGNSVYTVASRTASFTDMTSHWARNDVTLLASKFIVTGESNKLYAPGKNITRADFAEFVARGIGLDGDRNAATRFSDITVTNSSAAFIGAVSKAGIVEGGTDGKFRPSAAITREEMATMLVRAMNYVGVQTPASSTALNAFKDRTKVSGWAKTGMEICVTAGLIQGTNIKMINPQSNATRAEAAIMLKRFLEYVEFM